MAQLTLQQLESHQWESANILEVPSPMLKMSIKKRKSTLRVMKSTFPFRWVNNW